MQLHAPNNESERIYLAPPLLAGGADSIARRIAIIGHPVHYLRAAAGRICSPQRLFFAGLRSCSIAFGGPCLLPLDLSVTHLLGFGFNILDAKLDATRKIPSRSWEWS
jgi:hypothetical protein